MRYLFLLLLLACDNPLAPDREPPRQATDCMAWVSGGIMCCRLDNLTCTYYPEE